MVKISISQSVTVFVMISFISVSWAKLKEGECEVCIKVLEKFKDQLPKEADGDMNAIETNFMKFCKKLKGKEERFCYYLGGLDTSATSILNAMSKPMSYHKPVEKICEELKKKDMQMCELKYDKQIDLAKADLKKLKVKDLKRILDDWDESKACKGCAEKSDYIRVIKELMPKYAPEAHKLREEL